MFGAAMRLALQQIGDWQVMGYAETCGRMYHCKMGRFIAQSPNHDFIRDSFVESCWSKIKLNPQEKQRPREIFSGPKLSLSKST
jgi:hypothetical protein